MAVKTRKGPTTEKAPKQAVKSAVKKDSAPKPAAKKTAAKPAVKKAEPAKKSAAKAADKKPAKQEAKALDPVFLTEYDRYLFGKGRDYKIYQKMGAHPAELDGKKGWHFAVWAPHAKAVSIVCDRNNRDPEANYMMPLEKSGIFEGFMEGMGEGEAVLRSGTEHGCRVRRSISWPCLGGEADKRQGCFLPGLHRA